MQSYITRTTPPKWRRRELCKLSKLPWSPPVQTGPLAQLYGECHQTCGEMCDHPTKGCETGRKQRKGMIPTICFSLLMMKSTRSAADRYLPPTLRKLSSRAFGSVDVLFQYRSVTILRRKHTTFSQDLRFASSMTEIRQPKATPARSGSWDCPQGIKSRWQIGEAPFHRPKNEKHI
jgi:hypothetical protein